MTILTIIALALVVFAFVLLVIPIRSGLQLKKIKQQKKHDEAFKRKILSYQRVYQERVIRILIWVVVLLGTSTLLGSISIFYGQSQLEQMTRRVLQQEDTVVRLRNQVNALTTKLPIRSYPEAGIGLVDYEWKKIITGEETKQSQAEVELSISQKLAPYFGLSQVLVSIESATKTLSVSITGNTNQVEDKDRIEENVESLVDELNEVPGLVQVQLEMSVTEKKKTTVLLKNSYLREDDSDKLKLQEE